MLYLILLVILLIQFLFALGALAFVIFLARPEVPFSGDRSLERTAPDDREHLSPCPPEEKPPASRKNASRSSRKPTKQVIPTLRMVRIWVFSLLTTCHQLPTLPRC